MLSDLVLARIREARHIVVFTGAGVSAESGIPTFRDRFEGLWSKYDPEDVATPHAFRARPQFVWDWHVYLADAVRKARPNAGHEAIAQMQHLGPKVTVITQNIDNLHHLAGSSDVVELHGNLFRLKAFVDQDEMFAGDRSPIICPVCDGYALFDECDPFAGKEDLAAISLAAGPIPRCPCCGALLRPDIVWFGEHLDPNVLEDAWLAADVCDVLICVGSSLQVEPAASIPWRAHHRGVLVIEINPSQTELSKLADESIVGKAATVLPGLIQAIWKS